MSTLDAPVLFDLVLPGLTLEAGARLRTHLVRGWIWGPPADREALRARALPLPSDPAAGGDQLVVRRSRAEQEELVARASALPREAPRLDGEVPTVLVVHALTGDMRAGGPGGFWSGVVGPGRALDPARVRLLCFNNLGSCYGTSGPADEGFPRRGEDRATGVPPVAGKGAFGPGRPELPATLTSWDLARSLLLALDRLGVERVHLATGGSLGGMVVLALAALAPQRIERIAPFGSSEAASPWLIGWSHVGRQAVLLDPGFPAAIGRGLELARQLAHMSYRSEAGLALRQGRRVGGEEGQERRGLAPGLPYSVQTYLEHQGRRLVRRFDGLAYLAQLDAMDHHDLGRRPADPETVESWRAGDDGEGPWGLERIAASTLAVGIDSDELFAPAHMESFARRLAARGLHAEAATLTSPHGHDAFLIEWDQVGALLERAMSLPAGGRREGKRR